VLRVCKDTRTPGHWCFVRGKGNIKESEEECSIVRTLGHWDTRTLMRC
jgi:hypothetical protein